VNAVYKSKFVNNACSESSRLTIHKAIKNGTYDVLLKMKINGTEDPFERRVFVETVLST